MTEQGATVRWYNPYNTNELREFLDALWAATEIFRRENPAATYGPSQPLLWTRIKDHGGMHDRGTWLRLEQVGPGADYIVIMQRQPHGSDKLFNLTATETHEIIGWRST
jgi:hypothetical protein